MNAAHRVGPSLLLLLSPLLTGCAAGMATGVEEPVTPGRVLPVRNLAIMPVVTEAGSEGIRPGLARDLHRALEDHFPDLLVIGPDEARERLARSPAATAYADLLEDYERTGVVEADRLARVADALDVDHFLQVRASFLRENFLDAGLFEPEDVRTEERQVLAVVARLWSGRGSMPEWEAVIRTRSQTGVFTRRRNVDELIGEVIGALADRVPVRASRRPG